MDLIDILNSKVMKAVEKRAQIVDEVNGGLLDINQIRILTADLEDKKIAVILEALEEVTRTEPDKSTLEWLQFAEQYIDAQSNNLKREASRVVGNIAHLFIDDLAVSIQKLLKNTSDESTVVRWGSAYALTKIVTLPQLSNSQLISQLTEISEHESENGVKNQYIKSLKKAAKLRK